MKETKPCHCCFGKGTELDHVAVGADLRARREASGKTMTAIAAIMNISVPYLSDMERGRRNWTHQRIEQFTKACK